MATRGDGRRLLGVGRGPCSTHGLGALVDHRVGIVLVLLVDVGDALSKEFPSVSIRVASYDDDDVQSVATTPVEICRYTQCITRTVLGRAHTSATAADVAKLLLLNERRVTRVLPCGVCCRCPHLTVTKTLL